MKNIAWFPAAVVASIFMVCCAAASAFALDATAHRQLLVSVTGSWNDSRTTVFPFEYHAGTWRRVGKGMAAVVGERGLGWDPKASVRENGEPVKKEGDLKGPAGLFPLSLAMGFAPGPPAGATFPYRQIRHGTYCVDDGASPYYNRIVSESDLPAPPARLWKSSERMWEEKERYRLLLVVDYNAPKPTPGDGSCIFTHVWRAPGSPTTGCTALAEKDLTGLVSWLRPDAAPALVQLPLHVYKRIWREWRLPAPESLEGAEGKALSGLVDVRALAPEVTVDMRYAKKENFTGSAVYDCGRCFLLRPVAEKVAKAERELKGKGLSLKMWDCYRPLSVQKRFWALVPDPRYVADPKAGSRHNRGSAVDVTLVDESGREVEMPTAFDDFSARAAHSSMDHTKRAIENRRILTEAMEKAGFRKLPSEWWHYDDPSAEGLVMDVPFTELCRE